MTIVIGNVTDTPADYSKALRKATSLKALRTTVTEYRRVADDAYRIVEGMSEDDFVAFRRGLLLEQKGEFAGEEFMERFADVLLPELMFKVSMVAEQFGAPWGVAFIRLKEVGRIKEAGGVCQFVNTTV